MSRSPVPADAAAARLERLLADAGRSREQLRDLVREAHEAIKMLREAARDSHRMQSRLLEEAPAGLGRALDIICARHQEQLQEAYTSSMAAFVEQTRDLTDRIGRLAGTADWDSFTVAVAEELGKTLRRAMRRDPRTQAAAAQWDAIIGGPDVPGITLIGLGEALHAGKPGTAPERKDTDD